MTNEVQPIVKVDIGHITKLEPEQKTGLISSSFSMPDAFIVPQVWDEEFSFPQSETTFYPYCFIEHDSKRIITKILTSEEFERCKNIIEDTYLEEVYNIQNNLEKSSLPQIIVLSILGTIGFTTTNNTRNELNIDINDRIKFSPFVQEDISREFPSGIKYTIWRRFNGEVESWLAVIWNKNWVPSRKASSDYISHTDITDKKITYRLFTEQYVSNWLIKNLKELKISDTEEAISDICKLKSHLSFHKNGRSWYLTNIRKKLSGFKFDRVINKLQKEREQIIQIRNEAEKELREKVLGPKLSKYIKTAFSEKELINVTKEFLTKNENLVKENQTKDAEIDSLQKEKNFVYDEINKLEYEKNNLSTSYIWLQTEFSRLKTNNQPNNTEMNNLILSLLFGNKEQLTPSKCLDIISYLSKNVVILPEAYQSCKEIDKHFKNSDILLNKLIRFCTDYYRELLSGGETKARLIFTSKEYSFNESKTLSQSKDPELWSPRTVLYNGLDYKMSSHLKIGVSNNKSLTLRVYFFYDSQQKKLVIGYCGQHPKITKI